MTTKTAPKPSHELLYVGDCGTCHRPMRHATVPAEDAPGTVGRQNDDECKVCAQRSRHRRAVEDEAALELYRTEEAKLQHMTEWRARYERDRAARGIPRQGFPQLYERVDRLDPDIPPYADPRGPQATGRTQNLNRGRIRAAERATA